MSKERKRKIPDELVKGDALMAHSTRFAIIFLLYLYRKMVFTELQHLLGLTPGNLDSHLRKLCKAGYIEMRKVFTLRGPRTAVQITPIGRQGFREHATKLRKVLEKVK